MKGKTAKQQRDAVIKGFPGVPAWFRWVPATATAWMTLPNMQGDAAKFSLLKSLHLLMVQLL